MAMYNKKSNDPPFPIKLEDVDDYISYHIKLDSELSILERDNLPEKSLIEIAKYNKKEFLPIIVYISVLKRLAQEEIVQNSAHNTANLYSIGIDMENLHEVPVHWLTTSPMSLTNKTKPTFRSDGFIYVPIRTMSAMSLTGCKQLFIDTLQAQPVRGIGVNQQRLENNL